MRVEPLLPDLTLVEHPPLRARQRPTRRDLPPANAGVRLMTDFTDTTNPFGFRLGAPMHTRRCAHTAYGGRNEVAAENAARLLEDAMLQRLSRRRIARLAADIDMLNRHLVEIVETDAALAHRYRLLTSMPGVGLVLACTLMALLPELGTISRKQVAALVGVAPYAFESGKFKGRRCIWGGRDS
jgi:hypothetical protein